MKALRLHQEGGAISIDDVADPSPPVGDEVLVRMKIVSLNHIDLFGFRGMAFAKRTLPIIVGVEGAGVVEAVGAPDLGVSPGDRVAWAAGPGSYATHVVVAADRLVPVPAGLDTKIAAASMLQGMTAHYLAHATYPLRAGDTCLVHAAAGGVGLLLCQMASRAGAHVIGTVSTEEKAKLARGAGAHEIILYTQADFAAETRRLTGGRGVDVVYDSVGRTTFDKSLDCLRPRGVMVLYGQSSGAVPPVDLQILSQKGSLYVTRPTLGSYTATRA
ncbi:MAG: quinone oxidoreductase family protein, partial [Candidatus Eiseniibacteriota bacterium]